MSRPRPPTTGEPWLDAGQAAALLGVQRSSLYSYVSRGLLRAHAVPGQRGKQYLQADVQRLARQRQAVRNPAQLARSTMDWGQPVLASGITLVQGGQFFYRGRNAVQLSGHASLEETAALLWQQKMPFTPTTSAPEAIHAGARAVTLAARIPRSADQALAAWHGMGLQSQAGQAPRQPPAGAWVLLHQMCDALTGTTPPSHASYVQAMQDGTGLAALHLRLAAHWCTDRQGTDLLRRALVLCADHELNASSFAARVVASTGASLHASVGAGLAALSGPLHGGMTQQIAAHWQEWHRTPSFPASLQTLLQATQTGKTPNYCAGFGHPLYPTGDPRSISLLAQLPPDADRERLVHRVLATTGLHPSLDYSLVAVEHALALPAGAAFVLFALGRTAGWIAHVLEQKASGQLIRPRAQYTGPVPQMPQELPLSEISTPRRVIRF
ncbi:citrate synthase family protein [Comamonas sp. GB3 AK4-5]|uniref:citrate synthase family protein n=1 Tax=Comamonas sp. GB3 AK4-5 TaxID=3231487 RepID=UPI00351F4B15